MGRWILALLDTGKLEKELVDSFIDSGRPEDALHILENQDTQSYSYEEKREVQIKLAASYMELGQRDDAVDVLRDWLKKHPKDEFAKQVLDDLEQF